MAPEGLGYSLIFWNLPFWRLRIIDQPLRGRLGDVLIDLLRSGEFTDFYILSAYVKSSGVERLREAVEEFRSKGGKRVLAGVGIDQRNTSIQGLKGLLALCDTAWIYHNRNWASTFHPKVYVLANPNKVVVFIGSGNLTGGGLFTNYEAIARRNWNLTDPKQAKRFEEVMAMVKTYTTQSEFCQRLTLELITDIADDYLSDESKQNAAQREEAGEGAGEGEPPKKKIFGAKGFGIPPLPKSGKGDQVQAPLMTGPLTKYIKPSEKVAVCDWSAKGKMRWTKSLTEGDCQLVHGGTAATGRLNLTQAKWKDGGKLIDQTRYFRFDLFGNLNWVQPPHLPLVKSTLEIVQVAFCVKVKGKDMGSVRLTLRHDPKWESGQGNYVTGLSWGVITKWVKDSSLVGKPVSIYDPPSGQKEPFFLEIG